MVRCAPTSNGCANSRAEPETRGGGGHSPNTPTTGLCKLGNDTSKSTGRSGRQKAATRRNMRREEQVTVQGPVKEHQPDGMSHRGVNHGREPSDLFCSTLLG